MAAEGSVAPQVVGTQEDIHVTGRRILATLVDMVVIAFVGAVTSTLFGTITVHDTFGLEANLEGIPFVVYVGLIALYYILLEGYLGQTVGKMLLGIKVVREDNGEVPGLGAATIRTLLRLIDGLFSYLVAFISVLISAKRQRLGDMAAHTLVVRK